MVIFGTYFHKSIQVSERFIMKIIFEKTLMNSFTADIHGLGALPELTYAKGT